jgi:hypothetical protein
MIPALFLLQPALPWLFAARCTAAYWQTVADSWAMIDALTVKADIVRFPPAPLASHRASTRGHRRSAEIVRFTPARD